MHQRKFLLEILKGIRFMEQRWPGGYLGRSTHEVLPTRNTHLLWNPDAVFKGRGCRCGELPCRRDCGHLAIFEVKLSAVLSL